ncbi:MAG: imidazole glycerol phosphate synthase subunit HisH [Bacteroidia bacterium]|nr:imidazole glycerol phosphate synthase subunit HisH [Bacteroidia bacterium]
MIGILDYGAGNITSVAYMLQALNVQFFISHEKKVLEKADKIIFPGVGNASYAMQKIKEYDLTDFILRYSKPFLGICLGMQLLCEHTEEGNTLGLGIIPAKVKKFPPKGIIPHTGWNSVHYQEQIIFKGIPQDADFYFVHSYYVESNPYTIATCMYIIPFCCAVQKDNFWGVQFHPEKSAEYGKKLLQNFVNL